MSIPPLVCSSPPPPDQCEDDKDPEDFDLSYNLSQEDDDEDENTGYNYGNFSSYNNLQSATDNKPLEIKTQEITRNIESKPPEKIFINSEKESEHNVSHVFGTNDINENKLKCDEDLNIEDLNLKVDEEIESIVESNSEQHNVEPNEPPISSIKDFDIPCSSNNESPCDNTNVSSFDDSAIESTEALKELSKDLIVPVESQPVEIEINEPNTTDNTLLNDNGSSPLKDLDEPLTLEEASVNSEDNKIADLSSQQDIKLEQNAIDDDFGDFDDFQSVTTTYNVESIVDKSDNPWESAEPSESEFGNFTANFEESKIYTTDDLTAVESVSVSNNADDVDQLSVDVIDADNGADDDDDFGDFDDFQSSSAKVESSEISGDDFSQSQELPVLNLQSTDNEHQIMDSITKVLSAIFLEEISEPESEFEGKLESLLSETWGHLMETDERQPYIVNWNNSLGQKTLLRALCIDSRNILFGPKWSSNMPKYAANLSNAPLQPQKQASVPSSIVSQTEIVAEKSSSKPTSWNDPFTSDGQESCNTENESTTITTGPTDLDVFEAAVSTKSDKIFSNTIGVQPLRQINLPDTHIFTPTDSEIPRSKTIHYDRGPNVLLPQPATDNKNQTDTVNIPNTNSVVEDNSDDSEYWEFQNFKSTSDTSSLPGSIGNSQQTSQEKPFETATTVNALPKPNIAYQTELLQPIRVEPAMPTLNWPDPGEVKGVFDDFSDFVSITSQPNEKQEITTAAESKLDANISNKTNDLSVLSEKVDAVEIAKPDSNSLDDDFDTFQSAQASVGTSDNFKSNYLGSMSNQISNHITEFDNGSPKFDRIKSDTISFGSTPRPNEALTQNIDYMSKTTELTNNSSLTSGTHIKSSFLQPTPVNFNAVTSQQKSAQILQPLSLESYSQINWPSPGIDLQDLSRFNPVETLHSLKSDLSVSGLNKVASPVHVAKTTIINQAPDDDVWGEFVSSKPKQQQQSQPKKPSAFVDDDEWTDFISSPSVKPQNGLNTISLNVHTNSNIQKTSKFVKKNNQTPIDIPTLNYITPKTNPHKTYNDKHFQNL